MQALQSNVSVTDQTAGIGGAGRLRQTAVRGLNYDQASDTRGTTDTGPGRSTSSVKLVRVDRMLRTVRPVAPASVRTTGVPTPAVQAQQLANMKDAAITTSLLTSALQTDPRTTPATTNARQTANTEQFPGQTNYRQLPFTTSRRAASRGLSTSSLGMRRTNYYGSTARLHQ